MTMLNQKKNAEAPCQKQTVPFRVVLLPAPLGSETTVSWTNRADLFARITAALSATTINIPADHTTIQSGINVSTNDDTVLVQPGIYVENIIIEPLSTKQ